MKNSREAYLVFKRIIILLFIFFLINYYQSENNNYTTNKTILTEEKIKEFEKDVKNGNYVDIKKYTEDPYVETSNSFSNLGYNLGTTITDFFSVKLVDFFEFIGKFIS